LEHFCYGFFKVDDTAVSLFMLLVTFTERALCIVETVLMPSVRHSYDKVHTTFDVSAVYCIV